MKEIQLTQGKVAIVDDGDYEYLNQWKWYYDHGYARRDKIRDKKKKRIYMHSFIMNTPAGMETDHKDNDKPDHGLDNRRDNLRVATNAQNKMNKGKGIDNASGYKGVHWDKRDNKWRATISMENRKKSLGYFTDPIEAARAYDAAARLHHGEYASLNFPDGV